MDTDIGSKTIEELEAVMREAGEPPYRAKQVFQWLHVQGVTSFDDMGNLPKKLRTYLSEYYPLPTATQCVVQESKTDGTRKYLFALRDKECIESVFMRYRFGNSVCVSSQAGCRMGCAFCASTIGGLSRSLSPYEMLLQVYAIARDTGERISHVVVMGSGEPLDNYDNVLRFLTLLTDENGLHLSARNITVSTCGLVPEIRWLAKEKLQINLAISLHAATQEKRVQLMPIAARYPLPELMEACRDYYAATHRQLTFEYALVKGVNDGIKDAETLAGLLQERNCLVNLIPVNPVEETGLKATDRTEVLNFQKILEKYGIHVTIRREMGRDIDGACGQLRRKNV